MKISVTDAKSKLNGLVRRAEAGDDIVITHHGKPAVRLVPITVRPTIAEKKALLAQVHGKPSKGPSAARSQDFLYGDDGQPK
jgi:prevent-host-death family protein